MVLRGPSGASWGALEQLLGRSWALLGRSWGAIGSSWGYLGRSWGAFGTLLGALWRHLERSCGALGRFWTFLDDLDSILEPPRIDFGVAGGRFQASSRAREPRVAGMQTLRRVDPSRRQTDTQCERKARRVDPNRRHTARHPLRSKSSTTLS